jgi:hypothetical protein
LRLRSLTPVKEPRGQNAREKAGGATATRRPKSLAEVNPRTFLSTHGILCICIVFSGQSCRLLRRLFFSASWPLAAGS